MECMCQTEKFFCSVFLNVILASMPSISLNGYILSSLICVGVLIQVKFQTLLNNLVLCILQHKSNFIFETIGMLL